MKQTTTLYQQQLLAHHKNPHGFNVQLTGDMVFTAEGENPACGDEIVVAVQVKDDVINALSFEGDSCAICRASASMMCSTLSRLTSKQVIGVVDSIEDSFSKSHAFHGEYEALNSVVAMPIRQQCALLPWRTLKQVIRSLSK